MPFSRPFIHPRSAQQMFLREVRLEELQADGEAGLREAAGEREAGGAREVRAERVDVLEVHGERVGGQFVELERRGRVTKTDLPTNISPNVRSSQDQTRKHVVVLGIEEYSVADRPTAQVVINVLINHRP